MNQVKGTINALWALFLGFLFWPVLAFYNDGFIKWVVQVAWLFLVGYFYFAWRKARNAQRLNQQRLNQ